MKTQEPSLESHASRADSNDSQASRPLRREAQKSPRPAKKSGDNGHPHLDARLILKALLAARAGDFSARLPSEWTGVEGKLADVFNDMMTTNAVMEKELRRVSRTVGKEGKIRQRVAFSLGNGGAWRGMEESVNNLI